MSTFVDNAMHAVETITTKTQKLQIADPDEDVTKGLK